MKDTVILYQPRVDYKPHYPCFWAPLSILLVASPLVDEGIRVLLIDGNLNEDEKDKKLISENLHRCICVGISSMIGGRQLERALSISAFVKKANKEVPIVFGGSLATVNPKVLFDSPDIDYLVRGQGEQPFRDLVFSFIDKNENNSIPGVTKRGDLECSDPVLLDKNKFPPYPWQLLDVEKYIRTDAVLGKRVLNYFSSQGCPQKCGYCSEVSSYGCKWKSFTAERMLSEVIDLVKKYQLDGIKFYDCNFFANPKRVADFARGLVKSEVNINWGATAHPKGIIRLSDELPLIRKSGLKRILVGAESGSQKSLDYINKGCTIEDNLLAAELCAKHDVSSAFTFIVGVPGINEDIDLTLRMVHKMKKMNGNFDIKIHFYAPMPGTPLYDEAIRLGYNPPKTLNEWSRYDYYTVQVPWLKKAVENKVRIFGDFYCDFLYPPLWFLDIIKSNFFAFISYKFLRSIVELRCKTGFYQLSFEKYWFKFLTGKEIF